MMDVSCLSVPLFFVLSVPHGTSVLYTHMCEDTSIWHRCRQDVFVAISLADGAQEKSVVIGFPNGPRNAW